MRVITTIPADERNLSGAWHVYAGRVVRTLPNKTEADRVADNMREQVLANPEPLRFTVWEMLALSMVLSLVFSQVKW